MFSLFWPLVFFGKVLNHLGRFSRGWLILTTFLLWFFGVIEKCVKTVIEQIGVLIESLSFDQMGNADFTIIDGIGYVNAVFPLTEFIGYVTIYATAWLIVIIVRWIKSFVPTVAN